MDGIAAVRLNTHLLLLPLALRFDCALERRRGDATVGTFNDVGLKGAAVPAACTWCARDHVELARERRALDVPRLRLATMLLPPPSPSTASA